MQVSEIINNSNSYRGKPEKTIAIAIDDKQIDSVLDDNSDLYTATYRGWHAKFIKQHGLDLWLRYASTARQEGKNPERYFVWLLNKAT